MSAASLKQSLWNRQFEDITKLLRKSLHSADKYSKKIFEDQQKFYRQFASQFIDALKKTQNFEFTLSPSKIYNQLLEKLKALTELFFPNKKVDVNPNEIRIRHYRIQRFLRLLQQESKVSCRIHVENIRVLMQEQSKLNMKPDLFVFKSYIIGEASELQAYRDSNKSSVIKKEAFPSTRTVKMEVLHGYFPDEALKIITANIPTLNTYKTVFNKAMDSKEVKEVRQDEHKEAKTLSDDNETNSKTCFHYFGHAMQFDFFNSLFEPFSFANYLRRFSIIEDTSICRGLILGAFQGLPDDNDPDLSDSDSQQRWEQQIDKMTRQFCSFFEGYFQEQQESPEVKEIARRIAGLRRKSSINITSLLHKYWCK